MQTECSLSVLLKDINELVDAKSLVGKPIKDIFGNQIGVITSVDEKSDKVSAELDDGVLRLMKLSFFGLYDNEFFNGGPSENPKGLVSNIK